MMHIVKWNSIYCVKVIFSIKVRVIPIHDHHHFVSRRTWFLGIDYEYSVEAMSDVLFEGLHVTVIREYSEWFGCKFICKSSSWCNPFKYSVHFPWMYAVKVN